jgi:exonuclease SbcD
VKILHTADWHLGDRLGRMDRTEDLRRGVERIAHYCAEERIDVLLVAGDLFSERAGAEGLREAIRHLQETFEGFLRVGGTIVAITGNHDRETFCQTLRHAMGLVSPGEVNGRAPTGRLHLATGPELLRLPDRASGGDVQFLLMPYPTTARYLVDEPAQRFSGLDEKIRRLLEAFTARLNGLRASPHFDPKLPTVLSAHVGVRGSVLPTLFRLSEEEDVILAETELPADLDYVALGHVHRPQCLRGLEHVRYAGSLDRMDLGERDDAKSVVILDIGPEGLCGEPRLLPLEARPVYIVTVNNPKVDLPELHRRYPEPVADLVRLEITYTAGEDNREEVLREVEGIFPRWYDRDVIERNALTGTLVGGEPTANRGFEETVRDYLAAELAHHDEPTRTAVLARAEHLLSEAHS